MNQRLVWNFEFSPTEGKLPAEILVEKEQEPLKWEVRFFWPDHEIIILNAIDNALLDLGHYHQKHKKDYYYLLPDSDKNIKKRQDEFYYKPLKKRAKQALGYGAKEKIDSLPHEHQKYGTEVYVKKEAFIYKFPTIPTIKLELARLEVLDKIYFSACVEGKSLPLVEKITKCLLGKYVSCEYVSFLKNLLQS